MAANAATLPVRALGKTQLPEWLYENYECHCTKVPAWQYHLQKMVLEENPIKYSFGIKFISLSYEVPITFVFVYFTFFIF